MGVDIHLIGKDYDTGELEYVAVDPDTKAVLVKDIAPPVTDHGELAGLEDDDHTQYYNSARHTKAIHDALGLDHGSLSGKGDDDHTQYWNDTRGNAKIDTKITTHAGNASAHHAKTDKLSEITIDVDKDWNAKNITNMGMIEHKGATLKSGTQTEGRATCRSYAITGFLNNYNQALFREEMSVTPSSVTLSNAAETEEGNLAVGFPTVDWVTKYGFRFRIEKLNNDAVYYSSSKKFVTVGN